MAMGLLMGGLATAVIQKVVDVAGTHIEDYFKGRKGMGEELQRLDNLLPQIQSVIDAAERGEQQISDPLKKWFWRLKDVLYEADDVLDELNYHQLKQQVEADAKNKAIRLAKRIFKPDPTLDKLRRVVKKLDEVATGVVNFVALVSNAQREFQQQENQTIHKRETGPLLMENKVFGREKERDELVRWLMAADHEDESNIDVSLFTLRGHGGMGKTTLAQFVYNNETVQKSFDLKIWVCVSTSFDVRGLTRSILESATKRRPDVDGLPALQDALKEKLKTSGKFLLILDDVWNDDNSSNWDKLLAPLKYGHKGSKILMTTRMDRVADMVARAMGTPTKGSLKLDGLHGEDFSSLFNRYAFAGVNPGNYQNLQRIGMQIAKRLGSSPLAAKAVGGLLNYNLDDRYWTEILHSKNISEQAQHGEDNIMSILMLSYHHLPLHLRPCFAYCGMFPKDHNFCKGDLIPMWMAVGLIQHSHQNQGEMLEDIGGRYFDELLRRSLFDHQIYGDYYVIHDRLHDLAQSVSHGECFSFVDNDNLMEDIIPNTVRHLYIKSDKLDILTKMDNWHNLRSLVLKFFVERSKHSSALEKVFKSLKSIRMLNVNLGYGDVTMPDTFSHLIHLRSLKIGSGNLLKFPRSLCKLYHLQVIEFDRNKVTIKLPESMNKLVNLRHLSVNHQVVGVGKFIFLQDLSFSIKKERGYKIGELGDLNWLRSLKIQGLENVENQDEASTAKLCNKKYLQTLYLKWSVSRDPVMEHELVLDRLQPHSNLKNLKIKGYSGIRYANWMGFELINNLQCISIFDCSRLDHLPPLKRLPFLEQFKLKNMPAIKKLDYSCQRLKKLRIRNLEGLEELSGSGADADQWYPHLQVLRIKHCPKLEVMPSLSMSRREIHLKNVGLVSLPTLWLDRSSTCSTSGSLSSSSSLEYLKIHNCEKITSLGEGLLQLQHYLTTLEHLEICDCPELVDFPSGGLQHLRALKSLKMMYCSKLQVDPDRINPDGNDEKFLPPSLRRLEIEGCAELVRSLLVLLKGLVSLDQLTLKDCEELMSLKDLMGLQSIGILEIKRCQKLLHVAGTDTFFTLVDTLWIDDPLLLVSGVLRSLTSVRQLWIWELGGMEDLSTLEQWLLQNQTTLESITIWGASSLMSLPDSLKNLSSLKSLGIQDVSKTLIERCRKDEGADWPNISHIPDIIIVSLGDEVGLRYRN